MRIAIPLLVALLALVNCGSLSATAMPGGHQTIVSPSAPPEVVAKFEQPIRRAVDPPCIAGYCSPPAITSVEVAGNPAAWSLTVTVDVAYLGMGDPELMSMLAVGDYMHTAYAAYHVGLPVETLRYVATGTVKDLYGNTSGEQFLKVVMPGATAAKVNWAQEDTGSFWALSQVTWQDQRFAQAFRACVAASCSLTLPPNFSCEPARQITDDARKAAFPGC